MPARRITRAHVSKHNTKPGEGKVRIGRDTGLRKLMRAARRGKLPDDRMFTTQQAMRSALS